MEKSVYTELIDSFRSWRIWYSLGMQDILLRYRGSVLGPLWITISTAIAVYSMGYLYGILFQFDRQTYLPYFAAGMIIWSFISMIVHESTKIMFESKFYLENIRLPCTVYIFRLVFRNLIIFSHNLLVYVSVVFFVGLKIDSTILLLIPAICVFCLNGIFYGTVIAFISARFPDMGSIISSVLQVFFFITPIMWMPGALPGKFHLFLELNPFVYVVNLLRNPLLGIPFQGKELIAILLIAMLGLMLFALVLRAYRSRIIFWV